VSRNGSGTYNPPGSSFPAVTGTTIDSTKYNNVVNDMAAAVTASIANDGQTPILANLPMSGFKHIGAGQASASGQYVEYAQFTAALAAKQDIATLPNPIPAGTVMPFYQVNPPVGWATVGTVDDYMMRIVPSGSTGGTGGGSMSPILNNVVPWHDHALGSAGINAVGDHAHISGGGGGFWETSGGGSWSLTSGIGADQAASTAYSGAHTHTLYGKTDGNNGYNNWTPRYVDFCLGVKS